MCLYVDVEGHPICVNMCWIGGTSPQEPCGGSGPYTITNPLFHFDMAAQSRAHNKLLIAKKCIYSYYKEYRPSPYICSKMNIVAHYVRHVIELQ